MVPEIWEESPELMNSWFLFLGKIPPNCIDYTPELEYSLLVQRASFVY